MRKFEEYRNSVMEHVKKLLGKGYAITEQEIQKDNGIIWRGIGIQKESDPAVVIFYIDDVDEQYIEDVNMVEMTASDIVRIYIDQEKEKKKLIDITWAMRDFERAKERIRFRLINADKNKTLLENRPHIIHVDLAEVFYLDLGSRMAQITYVQMEDWGVDIETLAEVAMDNMLRESPAEILSMEDAMRKILKNVFGEEIPSHILEQYYTPACFVPETYVISNKEGILGASCILYPGILKDFADHLESDLIVLPASVDECILLKVDVNSAEDMNTMVADVNNTFLDPAKYLSGHAYLFTRERGQLELME